MKTLIPDILAALKSGERAALAIVLSSCGSTPRKAGSAMAVFENGASCGSVGGGGVEFEAQRRCREILAANTASMTEGFALRPDGEGSLFMICGGDVTIYFRLLLPENAYIFERAQNAPGDMWLCIETAEAGGIFLADKSSEALGGSLLSVSNYDAEKDVLTFPLGSPGSVYIFGGGHVGGALVETLSRLDFNCVVFDSREEYSTSGEYPLAARLICGDYKNIAAEVSLTPNDYVIVVTHGHLYDYEVLEQVLRSDTKYVGCMGSRRKTAVIRERLKNDAGLDDAVINRLHAPIGLKIGAETPAELAVSIAAELIAVRAEVSI